MKKYINKGTIMLRGSLTGLLAVATIANVVEYYTIKAAAFQVYLANSPELVEQSYQAATNLAHDIAQGTPSKALATGALTGLFGALTLCDIIKNKEQK